MAAWETTKDYTTGYRRDQLTDGRLLADVKEEFAGYFSWSVARQRMHERNRHGRWWDHLGGGSTRDIKAARRLAGDCLREHRVTKTAALSKARRALSSDKVRERRSGTWWMHCPDCKERVTLVPVTARGLRAQEISRLIEILADHFIRECDWLPAAAVKVP